MVDAPANHKAMVEIFPGMGSRNLYGITRLLGHFASLERLRLRLYDCDFNADVVNLKFRSMLFKLGVEEFSLSVFEPDHCDYKNLFSIPFKHFIWCNDADDGICVPYGVHALLSRPKPGLHLWGITDSLPEGATPEQIEALTDIYERIVQDVDSSTSEG